MAKFCTFIMLSNVITAIFVVILAQKHKLLEL